MNFEFLKEKVFETLGFEYEGEITFTQTEGMKASLSGGKAVVGGDTPSAVCRALTEFSKAFSEGKKEFIIEKNPYFQWCGPMLDMSREGVLKVESVKKYLDMIACLGMNMLMLYTEDTYEIEGYPWFGYKRGRYTVEELREIDDYAYALGIEVIPCIQTLGHLEKYLEWVASAPVKDTKFNIMPGTEESLKFIEDMLITCKKAFRSNNIHIGMDEAVDVGTGTYFKKHRNEVIDQHELIFDHLDKVCKLCTKYDYKPIIWSDLFFPDPDSREIYTYNSHLPEEYKDKIPENIRFMYWYYSGQNKDRYLTLLKRHKETGNPIAFGGSGWNWEGFAPNNKFGFDCSIPALEACLDENPEMLLNTLWGNGGCEPSFFLCFPSNALYAEYHWSGREASEERAWDICEFVTKIPKEIFEATDDLNFGLYGNQILGRKLLRIDVFETIRVSEEWFLNENLPDVFHDGEPMKTYREAADKLRKYVEEHGDWNEYFTLEEIVLRTAAYKAEIHTNLRKAYIEGDKKELERIMKEILPTVRECYKKLYETFQKQWRREYKMFGWEVHCQRFGFQIARIDYAIETIGQYLSGELSCIEELDAEPLHQNFIEYDTTMTD